MKKVQKLQVLALALFVGIFLWTSGVATAAKRTTTKKSLVADWQVNSDNLVFIEVSSEKQLSEIRPLSLFFAMRVLMRPDPVLIIRVKETPFVLHFPKSKSEVCGGNIIKLKKAVKGLVDLIQSYGFPVGHTDEIHVYHKDGAEFHVVSGKDGIYRHVTDLVEIRGGRRLDS